MAALGNILAALVVLYLIITELLLPLLHWIENQIPYGYEDADGFHYGKQDD